MLDGKLNYKNIILGIVVVIVLISIYYYFKKDTKTTNAVQVRLASKFDGEIVQVEPSGKPFPLNDFGEQQVTRVIYQSGFGSYIDNFKWKTKNVTLSVKANVNVTKVSDSADKSLSAAKLDTNAKPLYDYNPSSYAVITPCVQDRKLYTNNQCLNTESEIFKNFYMQNDNIYSRMLFGMFKEISSQQDQNEVGNISVIQTPTDVNEIKSIYLMFASGKTFSPVGKYLLKYGMYDLDTKVYKTLTSTPVSFEVQTGQNEVLIDIPTVKLYNETTKKQNVFFIEFRRVITNVSDDIKLYVAEILFNFNQDFNAAKSELTKKENVDVASIVDYGVDSRLQNEIDNEEKFCLSKGMQYLWTNDINTSRCVLPCTSDLDCVGDVYMEKENNSYIFVKLDEPKKCNAMGNLRNKQTIKYCTGSYPTPGPNQNNVPTYTL